MKVLIIRFSSLGDVTLATAVIETLVRSFPEVEIDLAVKSAYQDLFRGDPRIRKLWIWNEHQNFWKFVWGLRQERYDWIFDLHRVLRSFLLYPFLRRKAWVGCRKRSVRRRLYVRYRIRKAGWIRPLLEAYYEVLDRAGLGKEKLPPRLIPGEEAWKQAREMWESFGIEPNQRRLGLAPGALREVRRWPAEYFGELGKWAVARLNARVIVLGSQQETDLVAHVVNGVGRDFAHPVVGIPLDQLSALIGGLDLLVANDSGLAHVGRAMGIPVGVIFGPTSPEIFPPLGPRDFLIKRNLSCQPCSLRGERSCALKRRECLWGIHPPEVFPSVEKVLLLKSNGS